MKVIVNQKGLHPDSPVAMPSLGKHYEFIPCNGREAITGNLCFLEKGHYGPCSRVVDKTRNS